MEITKPVTHLPFLPIGVIAFALASIPVSAGAAIMTPHKFHVEQNIDKHQVGYIDGTIAESGKVSLTAKFSNGKQWAGNNFYSITRFVGKNGEVLHAVIQEKGLDGSFGGRAREGSVSNEFVLSSNQLENLDRIDVRMGVRNCGLKLIEMHDLTDWTFTVKECEGAPMKAVERPNPREWRYR